MVLNSSVTLRLKYIYCIFAAVNCVCPEKRPNNEIVKDLRTSSRKMSRRLQRMKTRHLEQIREFVLTQGI